MRGDRPKPTALKLIAGNPGKRPLNDREPQTGDFDLTAPDELTEAARAHWERLAPMLAQSGVMQASDRDILFAYCEAFAVFIAGAREGKVNTGLVGQLRQMLGEMGMTPATRSRIIANKAPSDGTEKKNRFFAA
ncbi:P27 family phage terminase small subunit [Dokdonella sp.]|uniref:P27 family phage terminase small subunit n=1 Tax=Dokdonella sp. TaxID=2291710 RepID=UPI0035273FC4